jgi:hypothetical protein
MAIVGLKSISPMKFLAGLSATTAVGIGSSLIGAIGASRARKDARRADAEARRRLAEAREEYNAIEFTNPYEGITNPYEGIQSQFTGMENVFEEPQVDTRAADFMREQSQQQQANILSNLRGVAGGSGVAGLAQQISNIGTQQARQAAVDIARQERQSEMARRGEASRIDMLQRQDAQRIDNLYGLAADRQTGTSQALNTAQTGFSEALGGLGGEIAGGVASGGINLSNFTERGRITNQLNAITPTLVDIGEEEETAQDIPGLIL